MEKVCPDPAAFKHCYNFKFPPSAGIAAPPTVRQFTCNINELRPLSGHFSKEELASLSEKAKSVLHNEQFRKAFQERVYFVDSGQVLPHRVHCLKSGKCFCDCQFHSSNNICHHCLAIAIHLDCHRKVTEACQGHNITRISVETAPKNVGGKAASQKRKLNQEK